MGLLKKDSLLKRQKLQIEKVDLNEEGNYVYVREMTGRERDNFERSIMVEVRDKEGKIGYEGNIKDFRSKLVVNAVCDKDGSLLLAPTDFEQLSESMSASNLEKLVNVAQRLSGISEEDKEALTKNSGAGQAGNSNLSSAGN